jgi:hypothetical protein
MDPRAPAVAEERLLNLWQMTETRREVLKTQLSLHTKQLDFVVATIRCFRDLFDLWCRRLQLTFHSHPHTNEVEEAAALEEAFMQLQDNVWRQLSSDFPALGKSC